MSDTDMDCGPKQTEECDHLGFATVDPADPGNDRGIFGKSVCPRCWGTGTVFHQPSRTENVEEPT